MARFDYPEETLERELGAELLRIFEDSYGKGARSTKVLLADDTIVVFLDGLELQPQEEFLIDALDPGIVVDQRTRFQSAMETTFRAVVERITGRRVTSFASITKLRPHYAVEIFRLAPPP